MQASFGDWTERLKVYNEYIKALGEYKLKTAQAELESAKAADKWATVRMKQIVIRQLERDIRAFNRSRSRNNRELRRITDKDKAARLLLRGRKIQPLSYSKAWTGYIYFESLALIQTGEGLYNIRVPASARNATNFINIRSTGDVIQAPSEITNALQFIHWLREQRYMTKAGGDAQRIIVQLFKEINAVATKSKDEIKERMKEIQDGTYNAWNFNGILGVSENPSGKKIQEDGTSN